MMIDTSLLLRKALAIAPRWVRYSIFGSLVVGELLSILSSVAITVGADGILFVKLSAIQNYQWEAVGVVTTMPICFLWRVVARAYRGPTAYDKAEEYIAILKMTIDQMSPSVTQRKLIWNTAVQKLAAEFSVGAAPPSASRIGQEIDSDRPAGA